MSQRSHEHLSADRLQAFLDGALPQRERRRVEAHLTSCARCSEEVESWRLLFEDLATLPAHTPAAAFRDRVMASVALPGGAPLRERLWRGLLTLLPAARPAHPAAERLQDLVDGALPGQVAARVAAHAEECPRCADEVRAWRAIHTGLAALPSYAPGEGFAGRVMAAVRIPEPELAPARAPSPALVPAWRRAARAAARFVPRTRRAWATLSGIAVTPAVTVGLVLFTVFSHPTLTPQALASFVLWQIGELAAAGWAVFAEGALSGAQVFGVDALVRTALEAPFVLAGGALAYSIATALALRVLYKNLLVNRRHARVSHS